MSIRILSVVVLALACIGAHADQNIVININGEKQAADARRQPNVVYQGQFDSEAEFGWKSPGVISLDGDDFYVLVFDQQGGGVEALIVKQQGGNGEDETFMHVDGGKGNNYTEDMVRKQLSANNWTYKWQKGGYAVTLVVTQFATGYWYPELKGTVVITKSAGSGASGSDLSALEKLGELRDKGILTEEEFQRKKKEILGF